MAADGVGMGRNSAPGPKAIRESYGDLLALAALEDLEIVLGQVGERAVLMMDHNSDFHSSGRNPQRRRSHSGPDAGRTRSMQGADLASCGKHREHQDRAQRVNRL